MIKKGTKVQWAQDQFVHFGVVEETYTYKVTRKIKENSVVSFSNTSVALYIKVIDGTFVLKNETEVLLNLQSVNKKEKNINY
ncbi:hypothetical protein [Aquimarina latercula]|uniref:hypothetical protein n=1 Tax=Aquimarina latercula TaxID=987 RepID=UPI0004188A35|nr:hypothetical protein [Aquimarina latercula]